MPRITTMPGLLHTFALALASLLALPAPAASQDWPTRPMTMVIPFSAAGGVDVVGRIMAARMAEILRRPVIIENVGGAGGMVGSSRVAKATPDGYQFVLGSVGTHAQNQTLYKNPLYNTATDFAPVALVAEQPIILAARNTMPAGNLRRVHRLREGEPGEDAVRLARLGLVEPPRLRAAHLRDRRHQGHAHPLSHRRRRPGPDRRPDRLPVPDRRRRRRRSAKANRRR